MFTQLVSKINNNSPSKIPNPNTPLKTVIGDFSKQLINWNIQLITNGLISSKNLYETQKYHSNQLNPKKQRYANMALQLKIE